VAPARVPGLVVAVSREQGSARESRSGDLHRERTGRRRHPPVPRDPPSTLGITAIIGVRFPDLVTKPSIFDNPLTGTPPQIAEALAGYATLGVQHVMLQHEPYTDEARHRLAQALRLYRNRPRHLA
jgi:alkanesulfonate monooxygenase SsuD/methylene tetrahydromethanopterin reductase-like flavin-dependent oxidoreductase (luciferase family)